MGTATALSPRPYASPADRAAVLDLLRAGLRANEARQSSGYYVHPGDVNWWLDYLNQDDSPQAMLTLWEQGGALVAWSLLSPKFGAADVFVHPDHYGSHAIAVIWAWTMDRLRGLLPPGELLQTVWVAEDDAVLRGLLAAQGFAPLVGAGLIELRCLLAAARPAIPAPPGFALRPLKGEVELESRAAASHAAFGSGQPLDVYAERYRRFMHAPGYGAAADLVAVETATGAIVAFALAWPDAASGLGLFEPLGTHPAYRRRGLARALLAYGLDQLQNSRLRAARINVEADNEAALALYHSLGFQRVRRLLVYQTPPN